MGNKKWIAVLLVAACLLGCGALPAAAEPYFPAENTYTPGQFCDVALNAWYTPYLAQVYALGLMQGSPNGAFCPGGSVTLAETVTLAARMHRLYRGDTGAFPVEEPWYRAYVDYAMEQGILTEEYPDYNAAALRREFAVLLSRALPREALAELNGVEDGQIPDVAMDDPGAGEIYALYRAGVLLGNDAAGTFAPDTEIRRSEVAAIAARMADPELRLQRSLRTYPCVPAQAPAEDAYFSDAAMLGNSLVDGMMLCSGLKMTFYGGTSLTVYNNRLGELLQKPYGKVYIQFGINELGGTVAEFIDAYRTIITRIRAAMPEAEIYLMAITPVTRARSDAGVFTMKKIQTFNEAIYDLAGETQCWYLDTCTSLCDETGYLPAAYGGWDGSPHLSDSGYQAWAEVIRTHYIR